MKDDQIVQLYWDRQEEAVVQTAEKYGGYLHKIAWNVLSQEQDCEECVNDTYLKTWNSIPPNRPVALPLYLGKITRALAIDTYRRRYAQKRSGSEYALSLAELSDTFSDGKTPESELQSRELVEHLNRFLMQQPERARTIFLGRYYYFDSLKAIASYCGVAEGTVKSSLYRTRQALRAYLIQEGYEL